MHERISENTVEPTFPSPFHEGRKTIFKKATAGSVNKVITRKANIHMALKNNEISSHPWGLPKDINKKKNRSYSILQKQFPKR